MPILHDTSEKISGSQALDDEFGILLQNNMSGFVDRELAKRFEALAESAFPPSNNMGGTYPLPPLFFPHREKSDPFVVKNKTKIDWLAFTSAAEVEALKLLLGVVWPGVVFSRNSHGMPGYPDSESILVDCVQYGLLGFGAAHGRNFVSLTGTACKTLTDELIDILHEALSLPQIAATLSRVDICFDLYRGERTFDHAIWAYEAGHFKRPKASIAPELKVVGTTRDGRNLGRTMYVGKRDGEVMARIYEKGLEVFAKLSEDQRFLSEQREAENGVQAPFADDWLRLEVEYKKRSKDRPLPLDMLLLRDEYFAGAYPYFADVLGAYDGLRPSGIKSDVEVDLLALMAHAKRSYGSLIHSLHSLGFTDAEIVADLSTGRHNDKLVKSGLFAKIKQHVDSVLALDPDSDIPF